MDTSPNALLTDLYQLNMVQAYLEVGQTETAIFEFFIRKLPPQRNILMAAGLEQALEFLQGLRFSDDELSWLTRSGRFSTRLDDETAAFEAFARARPKDLVLLIDTYDTEVAARKVVTLAPRLRALGITICGVRIDSGDLVALSKSVRRILDEGGLKDVTIFVSGGIEEETLLSFAREAAPLQQLAAAVDLRTK